VNEVHLFLFSEHSRNQNFFHEGHEGTRSKTITAKVFFVLLRVLRGCKKNTNSALTIFRPSINKTLWNQRTPTR
jgi:hypothetical protein